MDTAVGRRLARLGMQQVQVEIEPCQWADEVAGAAVGAHRMERRRVRDVFFEKDALVLRHLQPHPARGNNVALVHRILGRMSKRDKLVVRLEIGETQARHPRYDFERSFERPLQVWFQSQQFAPRRNFVESADTG
jgi:hypothetical protein